MTLSVKKLFNQFSFLQKSTICLTSTDKGSLILTFSNAYAKTGLIAWLKLAFSANPNYKEGETYIRSKSN
jgi:hypothetical protein